MKNTKRQMIEEIKLPNQEKIRTLGEKEIYKYLGILEANTIKPAERKKKLEKNTSGKWKKLLKTKQYSRNFMKGINTWAFPFVIYSEPFLLWVREEL